MYRAQPDTGSTHVLEAVIIASVMVSAVAFVVSFESPEPPAHAPRDALSTRARDVLDILYDTPVQSKFGSNALSAYIAECLNQRCTNLTQKIERLIPPGASYSLYLSNGYDTYPVIEKGAPEGEAVSASRIFEPEWSSTFLATATESISPEDALLVYSLPIYRSTPVAPGGSQLLVKVSGTRNDGSEYVLTGSAATVALDANDLEAVAASLYFIHPVTEEVLPVTNLTDEAAGPMPFKIRLAETQDAPIPAGTELAIHIPRGWNASAASENPGWSVVANGGDRNASHEGSGIRAVLTSPLQNGVRDFVFYAEYHRDALDFYPFAATLSKGAMATAGMLVRAEVHDVEPTLATPLLHLSVPGPMGRGAETTWTLAAHIPVNATSLPGGVSGIVRVRSVEIIEQEGNDIFAGAVVASLDERQDGTWTNAGDHLKWTGDVQMHVHSTLNLTFRVAASGEAGPSLTRPHFLPPVEFDDWTGRLVGRTGWGFHRQAILPASSNYEGYDPTADALGLMHPLSTRGVFRQTVLPGDIQYNVSLVGSVQDSLYGSYVTAQRRSVGLGENIEINANVQSLLFALADAGQQAGVTLRIYPPWSGDTRIPIFKQANLDQGLLSGEVTHIVTLDLNNDGYPDPIVGTDNGRVIAYHGLTGQRLQGNVFTANLTGSQQQQAVPKITALTTVKLQGKDHIVVGTDAASEGLYVLNTSFGIRWKHAFDIAGDTLGVDATQDFNGDDEPEIVVARSHESGASKYGLIYVFEAPPIESDRTLDAIPGDPAPTEDPLAIYRSLGTPTTLLAQSAVGPTGTAQGVLVPIQTNVDPGLTVTFLPPTVSQGPISSPRAGVQGILEDGTATSTLFGAPASVLVDYDHNGDDIRDVVLGGSSGYVIMANGEVLTQPIYSYIVAGAPTIVAADAERSVDSFALASNGRILTTDDGWVTTRTVAGLAVGGKAIATDGKNSFWVVGSGNSIWRSEVLWTPPDAKTARHPQELTLDLQVLGADPSYPEYDWENNVHEFRTVDFQGSLGYIGGTVCASEQACTEPILLMTMDGGESWVRLSKETGTLLNRHDEELNKNITKLRILPDGSGLLVGDGGLVARAEAEAPHIWRELPTDFIDDLADIACRPPDFIDCMVVGAGGAAYRTYDITRVEPDWTELTGRTGLPLRDLYAVGFPDATRGYIGTKNMVLSSKLEADWTALPLNYFENDALVVSTPGDGTGYVYGGTPGNARIWALHDHHISSQVTTKTFADEFGEDDHISRVALVDGNVSFAQQKVIVEVTEGTTGWHAFAPLAAAPLTDTRLPVSQEKLYNWQTSGRDLQFRITLETSGDKTILTPQVRALTFLVDYKTPDALGGYADVQKTISLDLTSTDQVLSGDADWSTVDRVLRQPLVEEFWTRDVKGEVHDILTGHHILGTPHDEVWVATGDVLAENNPDHIIYAGSDPQAFIEPHNRIYLLNGLNGHVEAVSVPLAGEVLHIRMETVNGVPDTLWAATWDSTGGANAFGLLYAIEPDSLIIRETFEIGREVPSDLELALFEGPVGGAFVGAGRPPAATTDEAPHLWAIREEYPETVWKIIPDDLGKYFITTKVKPSWLYGPYVVEIEVEWDEGVDTQLMIRGPLVPEIPQTPGGPEPEKVIRSARFYDHFMVTPPDAISSPNPLYTARLLVWMKDWS